MNIELLNYLETPSLIKIQNELVTEVMDTKTVPVEKVADWLEAIGQIQGILEDRGYVE